MANLSLKVGRRQLIASSWAAAATATVRGRVVNITEEGADAHIDSLAKKYLGQDKYTIGQPGEVRLTCEIEPMSASGMG